MRHRPVLAVAAAVVVAIAAAWAWRGGDEPPHYTGFVEGEERVLRSEVAGRVLEVRYAEGAAVEPNAVVAVLDGRDVATRIEAKERELAVLAAQRDTQQERLGMTKATWGPDVSARRAELRAAESALRLAERTFEREEALVSKGASTPQLLDESRAARDQARSQLARAREMLARAEAEEGQVSVAAGELETLKRRAELAAAELAELRVLQSKYEIRAPGTPTIVQTQYLWPGELAQPGSAVVSVLDPRDKYVQIFVPVGDLAHVRVGRRVWIELDSRPGDRIPGEVSFIADRASFTPEKIETRSDRVGQVYRAKVRVLERIEELRPGTEGDVHLAD